jgi:acetoacetate decarboxylase
MYVPDVHERHEMPITFGSVPMDHIHYDRVTNVTIPFRTEKDALAALLPPGLEPADDPVVTVGRRRIEGASFVAGQEYQIVAIGLAAVFQDEDGPLAGAYAAVAWEDNAAAIILGRESYGVPKIWADIPAIDVDADSDHWDFTCSEYGTPLLTGNVANVEKHSAERTAEIVAAMKPKVNFHYKHLPSQWGEPDISYLALGNTHESTIEDTWSGEGRVEFHETTWEKAPAGHRVVAAFRSLPVVEWLPASATRGPLDIVQHTGRKLYEPSR